MKFEGQNCQVIRQAVQSKQDIEFKADISNTIFADNEAPEDWTEYPPSILSDTDFAKVKAVLAIDGSVRAALHRLEQTAHEQGAKVYYKALDGDTVSIKVEW
ncbi:MULTISPECIES: hypothetical protein [unclassified Thioalkalivibrio]|uniref:hypothetical protein n=1 Tax=unclassified Thioalkalivibrio TaxID=2621013 RepID=UPI0012DDBD80|nr:MULTISPECIES: hypothetical protein [unclassified Thioalkalivibrio]